MKLKVSPAVGWSAFFAGIFLIHFLRVERILPLETVLTPFPLTDHRYLDLFQSAPEKAVMFKSALFFIFLICPFMAWFGVRLMGFSPVSSAVSLVLFVGGFGFFDPLSIFMIQIGYPGYLMSAYAGLLLTGLWVRFTGLKTRFHWIGAFLIGWIPFFSVGPLQGAQGSAGLPVERVVLGFLFPVEPWMGGFELSFFRGLVAISGVGGLLLLRHEGEKKKSRFLSGLAAISAGILAAGLVIPPFAFSILFLMLVLSAAASEFIARTILQKSRDWPFWVVVWALWFLLIAPLGPGRWLKPLETGIIFDGKSYTISSILKRGASTVNTGRGQNVSTT